MNTNTGEKHSVPFWPITEDQKETTSRLYRRNSYKITNEYSRNEENHGDKEMFIPKNYPQIIPRKVTPEKLFKLIIVGDPTVGKTAFVQRYVTNVFKREFKGTVGVDFSLKILNYSENLSVKLQLWDIAGQERFTWMTRVYYKDAHGCVIMFDLSNRTSFHNTMKWKQDVDAKCSLPNGFPIPCMLLANKCDLSGTRQIEQMEIETLAKENDFIGWTEVSAKEGLMVNDSMKFLVDSMLEQEKKEYDGTSNLSEPLKLNSPTEKHKSICSC